MILLKSLAIFGIVFLILFSGGTDTFAEHIFSDRFSSAEIFNLAELSGEKYPLIVNGTAYEILYGSGASFDDFAKETLPANVSDMRIDQKNKSLIITFNSVPEPQTFWIILPLNVISAEQGNYQLFIDSSEKGYEIAKYFETYSMGFFLPKDSQKVEIIGTNVVPEFGALTITILGIAILAIVLTIRGKSRFFNYN